MLADRPTPLDPLRRPLARDQQAPLRGGGAHRGQRQAPGIERGKRDLQAVALPADPILGRHHHVVQPRHPVLDTAQPEERVAVLHGDPIVPGFDDERGEAAAMPLGSRHPRQHHQQVRQHTVGRPELDPVERVGPAVLAGDRAGGQPGGIAAHIGFGEQEGRDLADTARQELPLLLRGAEQLHRLRHADGLVRGEQGADRWVGRGDDHQSAVVVDRGQPEAAVLRGDLDAEGADVLEPVDHLVRDPRVPLDLASVDLRLAELA